MSFNFVDALLIFFILLSVLYGWQRGFILSLLDLLRWIGSLLAGLYFYQAVARRLGFLNDWTEVWNQPLAFVLIVLVTGIAFQIAAYALLRRLPRDVHKRSVNRLFGTLPGFVNGLILAAILSSVLFSMPFSDGLQEKTRESRTANYLAGYTEELETALSSIFGEAVQQTLNRRTIHPESNDRVELPFKVAETRPRPEIEAEMLEMVNRERAANGLKTLEADPELTEVARRHSADMFARGYFSHNTPENLDPFDRMRSAGVRYTTAGENLALAPTVKIAHSGLMNSPGHRANILRPQFGRVGIGIMDGGRRGLMVTQNFRN
ncbi:MAG TPA: CvpA family protein [Pyrinomonadaceae bacterium]|nr:CvpA family protein [Pyrinomonadaceae bacterium]